MKRTLAYLARLACAWMLVKVAEGLMEDAKQLLVTTAHNPLPDETPEAE